MDGNESDKPRSWKKCDGEENKLNEWSKQPPPKKQNVSNCLLVCLCRCALIDTSSGVQWLTCWRVSVTSWKMTWGHQPIKTRRGGGWFVTLNTSSITGTTTIGLHIANRVVEHLLLKMASLCYLVHQEHMSGKVKTDLQWYSFQGHNDTAKT